jgi:hypothetical protein
MNIIQQICSEPTGWAALGGWVLWAISDYMGANPRLRDNWTIGFVLRILKEALPVDVEVKAKAKRRSSRSRTRSRRDSSGRFLPQDPDQ